MKIGNIVIASIGSLLLGAGCSSTLHHDSWDGKDENLSGVPWVESREYEVYVVKGVKKGSEPDLLYYGRHLLSDKVNENVIDKTRAKWMVNYKGRAFSDGALEMDFNNAGSLNTVKITSSDGTSKALAVGSEAVSAKRSIEEAEIANLERELKLLGLKKDIADAEKELSNSAK